jgi:hypothetical protein
LKVCKSNREAAMQFGALTPKQMREIDTLLERA